MLLLFLVLVYISGVIAAFASILPLIYDNILIGKINKKTKILFWSCFIWPIEFYDRRFTKDEKQNWFTSSFRIRHCYFKLIENFDQTKEVSEVIHTILEIRNKIDDLLFSTNGSRFFKTV